MAVSSGMGTLAYATRLLFKLILTTGARKQDRSTNETHRIRVDVVFCHFSWGYWWCRWVGYQHKGLREHACLAIDRPCGCVWWVAFRALAVYHGSGDDD